jgi:hypothetical protein
MLDQKATLSLRVRPTHQAALRNYSLTTIHHKQIHTTKDRVVLSQARLVVPQASSLDRRKA